MTSKYKKSRTQTLKRLSKVKHVSPVVYGFPDIDEYTHTTFVSTYPVNIAKIKESLKESGKHGFHSDVNKFIDGQISPIRRQAAKDLIENTKYITLQETFHIIEELIQRVYARIDTTKEVFLYCGENKKSFYFFACIAYYFILKHRLKPPIFLKKIAPPVLDRLNVDTLLIVDDASYSGFQLGGFLDGMHYYACVLNKRPPINIEVLLVAVNTMSLQILSRVTLEKSSRGSSLSHGPSPLHINVLDAYNYNALVVDIGIERYFYVNLFFNAFLNNNTHIALYLDYKVADSTSTYKNVYLYGTIIPNSYNLSDVSEFIFGGGEIPYMYNNVPTQVKDALYEQFIVENPMYVVPHASELVNYKTILWFLMKKAITMDKIDRASTPYMTFVPFIQSCKKSKQLKHVLKNELLKRSKYIWMMYDIDVLKDFNEDHENFLTSELDTEFMQENYPTLPPLISDREETKEVLRLLESYRCPRNFYKDGYLQME
jgi:hypothetical protein